jgi:hypothetical protein
MRIFDGVVLKITKGKKEKFSDLADWAVAIMGAAAFFIAGFLGLVLSDVVPETIKISNKVGITLDGLLLGALLLALSLKFWFFGNIAARCNGILYERWFQ